MMASPLAAICRSCAEHALSMIPAASGAGDPEANPVPWSLLEDDGLLTRLPEVAAAGRQVEQHLGTWVDAARERGISWARIGDALGMTRQSAWERFAGPR